MTESQHPDSREPGGRAWVVRAGRYGEDEQANLDAGRTTISWHEMSDLTPATTREAMSIAVEQTYPDAPTGQKATSTGQLWAFRSKIQVGDLIVMPLKSESGHIAFGRCTGPYAYDPSQPASRRHYRPVTWEPNTVPRSALGADLLATINSLLTVFSPSRNDAARRLAMIAKGDADPGIVGGAVPRSQITPSKQPDEQDEVTDPPSEPTLEAIEDRVRTYIMENFREHELTKLIAAILEALGFVCDVSPAGPDGGVDILAGTGPFGFGAPTVVVEVKSEPGPVGSAVMRTLHSAVTRYGADHGVLVAWGGISSPARSEFAHLRTSIRVWSGKEILEKLFETYPRLPDAIRNQLPLKQAWVLDDTQV
ncbi:MAG TPA: restriction endonuclease [Arachnia sp.]|nr:restriction endonuclease [Arachnia sp.]HMT85032.1 restriction endonuclease [Arachnia sp.]